MEIKLNCKGKIIKGAHAGWYTLIECSQNEPDYLIIISNELDFASATKGFDQWVENRTNLESQIEYYGWEIEWLEGE